jgi:hypothetical protein
VNVKRRLRDKGIYETENVRPYKISKALQYLISHATLWRGVAVQLRPEFLPLLESAVEEKESADSTRCETAEKGVDQVDDNCLDDDLSSKGEEPDVHAFGDETMIDDGAAGIDVRDTVVNVAPAEGQHPVSVYLDKYAAEMAFPNIFGGCARPVNNYTYKQLCRVELGHFRRLVAQRPGNIFFKFRKLQILDMKQLTWVRLRKSKLQGKPLLKASQLTDPVSKQSLLQANIGFRDFKQLRGTPDYDEQGKKEAYAMLRQLGPFTFFFTFSMADMKWPEFIRCLCKLVDGEEVALEQAAQLSWKRIARLVRSDHVSSARYHRHRMEALLSVMKKYDCISGPITDYFWRDEFQQRGTPHTHMAVYVRDTPILGVHSDRQMCEFIDRFISTSAEGVTDEDLELQQHGIQSDIAYESADKEGRFIVVLDFRSCQC